MPGGVIGGAHGNVEVSLAPADDAILFWPDTRQLTAEDGPVKANSSTGLATQIPASGLRWFADNRRATRDE